MKRAAIPGGPRGHWPPVGEAVPPVGEFRQFLSGGGCGQMSLKRKTKPKIHFASFALSFTITYLNNVLTN